MDFESSNGVITLNGQRFHLKGLNWFGFETDLCNLHGLWSVSLSDLLDFCSRHRFNALRVPFSCELASRMDARHPGGLNDHANPDLKGLTSGQVSPATFSRSVQLKLYRTGKSRFQCIAHLDTAPLACQSTCTCICTCICIWCCAWPRSFNARA